MKRYRFRIRVVTPLMAWVLSVCWTVSSVASASEAPEVEGRLNVILLSLDTVRPDHLSCYGYHRKTTPTIDRLAKEGVVFTQAFSQVPETFGSHLALFTSRYPSMQWVFWQGADLDASTETLTEILNRHGYDTAAFTAPLHPKLWASRPFETFDEVSKGVQLTSLPQELFDWLEAHREQPFFLFLHGYDAHQPHVLPIQYDAKRFNPTYEGRLPSTRHELSAALARFSDRAGRASSLHGDWSWHEFNAYYVNQFGFGFAPDIDNGLKDSSLSASDRHLRWTIDQRERYRRVRQAIERIDPEELQQNVTHLKALYDAQLYYLDQGLEQLVVTLKNLELMERTLLIIVSDHGQAFGEHGLYADHRYCYDEVMRIVLIVRDPRLHRRAKHVHQVVQGIDVMPTILELLELPVPESVQGRSLVALLKTGRDPQREEAAACVAKEMRAIRTPKWKLVSWKTKRATELYRITTDPREQRDVSERHPNLVERLTRQLDAALPLDPVEREAVGGFLEPDQWMQEHGYW